MKRVEAEVHETHLTAVRDRLQLIGVAGMTVASCASLENRTEVYRGAVLLTAQADVVRIHVIVTDDMADSVARAVIAVVRRHPAGDGVITIAPVDDVIRIATGQTGADAL